jgi:hypothetical protein
VAGGKGYGRRVEKGRPGEEKNGKSKLNFPFAIFHFSFAIAGLDATQLPNRSDQLRSLKVTSGLPDSRPLENTENDK